jgi:hypothetical protein
VEGAPLPDPDTPVPPRYLPDFDNILLAHSNRSRIIGEAEREKVFTINGLVRATVLVDGMVRGMWRIIEHGSAATLVVELFHPVDKRDQAMLESEGARLLEFSAPGAHHDLQFRAVGSAGAGVSPDRLEQTPQNTPLRAG